MPTLAMFIMASAASAALVVGRTCRRELRCLLRKNSHWIICWMLTSCQPKRVTEEATSYTSHSIQNFNYLLQLHLWNSPSVSVRSPSTLCSSKTITICIWHTNLCHPPCKHKNIWWKIFFLCWPICLEQFASNTPPLWFYLLFQSRPQDAPV